MIRINRDIVIDENEIKLEFVRSSGPGGQNVNKVSSAVQLRFDVAGSLSLPSDVRGRLISLARKKINENGTLIIDSRRFRSQLANRQDAIDRLVKLIRQAARKPVMRKKTKPTAASREVRLDIKMHRAGLKRQRRKVQEED
jgi:ribosome-associated protein